ncbi:MAG: hypothetical protein ACOYLE_00240 [Bacteroidales bacterium]
MKKIIFALFFILISILTYSQEKDTIDVVTMIDSTIYKGSIIDSFINNDIRIRTDNGRSKKIKFSDINNIKQEVEIINLKDYGCGFSYGIALFGGGIVGIPFRIYLEQQLAFEVGAYLRPLNTNNNEGFSATLMIAGGFNFFINKSFNIEHRIVRLNGISLKGGCSIDKEPEVITSLGYVYERFKKDKKNKSIVIEIGIGAARVLEEKSINDGINFVSYVPFYKIKEDEIHPMIYIKFGWNFYAKRNI